MLVCKRKIINQGSESLSMLTFLLITCFTKSFIWLTSMLEFCYQKVEFKQSIISTLIFLLIMRLESLLSLIQSTASQPLNSIFSVLNSFDQLEVSMLTKLEGTSFLMIFVTQGSSGFPNGRYKYCSHTSLLTEFAYSIYIQYYKYIITFITLI